MDDFESLYQGWLEDYAALEALAPLSARDAMRLGGQVFEQRMRQAVAAGAYSQEWIEQLNQFSLNLYEWQAEFGRQLSYPQRNCLLQLQDNADQLNPEEVLAWVNQPPQPKTTPDTIADQLAQGATLCQLF